MALLTAMTILTMTLLTMTLLQAGLLYPFPRLHPSSRQSMLDVRALPQHRFGRFHAALHGSSASTLT